MLMKYKSPLRKCLLLTFGIVAVLALQPSHYLPGSPTVACGNNVNCTYAVEHWECSGACSCGSNLISNTCYWESGTCTSDGSHVSFSHCYQGGCCCPSGNCAGQGAG